MSRRSNRVADSEIEVPEASPQSETPADKAPAAEVRVQCLTNKVGTTRGRIIFGQRINLPAEEAQGLADGGAVEIVTR